MNLYYVSGVVIVPHAAGDCSCDDCQPPLSTGRDELSIWTFIPAIDRAQAAAKALAQSPGTAWLLPDDPYIEERPQAELMRHLGPAIAPPLPGWEEAAR